MQYNRLLSSGTISIFNSIQEMRSVHETWMSDNYKSVGKPPSIGFVPTMGALHDGHIALIKQARDECDKVVVSIFLNPKQFAANEDLDRYPKTYETDLNRLKDEKVDAVFTPNISTMYPERPEYGTYIHIDNYDKLSEGASRPGFFKGVVTVVTKLFNIVQPSHSYFGQKDGLQCLVIKQLVRDLNIPVTVKILPTSRESDGLAMSSRNVYLNDKERKLAPLLYQSLQMMETLCKEERNVDRLKAKTKEFLIRNGIEQVQYISIADNDTGEELQGGLNDQILSRGVFVSSVIVLGTTRLIDNIVIKKMFVV